MTGPILVVLIVYLVGAFVWAFINFMIWYDERAYSKYADPEVLQRAAGRLVQTPFWPVALTMELIPVVQTIMADARGDNEGIQDSEIL